MTTRITCLAFISLIGLIGCGGEAGPPRYKTSGKVTFDGKPVETGSIVFNPVGPGQPDSGKIENGTYTIQGTPGPKKISIMATRLNGELSPGVPNNESYIPKKYNTETTLTADIKPTGENTVDFELAP